MIQEREREREKIIREREREIERGKWYKKEKEKEKVKSVRIQKVLKTRNFLKKENWKENKEMEIRTKLHKNKREKF